MFAAATVVSAEPVVSPLEDTWRIISGSSRQMGLSSSFVQINARDVRIVVEASNVAGGDFNIRINGDDVFAFDVTVQGQSQQQLMFMRGGAGFVQEREGEYAVPDTRPLNPRFTFIVEGDFLNYTESITPINYMNLRLQRVSTIRSGGGGGGCNSGFGILALAFAALFLYGKKND